MANNTKIEWTNKSWNPISGCTKISPGCANCYAERMANRLQAAGVPLYQGIIDDHGRWTGVVALGNWDLIQAPFHWKKPSVIFVNSMSDLFHPDIPHNWVDLILSIIAVTPQHTYQVLTKRPHIMCAYFDDPETPERIYHAVPKNIRNTLTKAQYLAKEHPLALGFEAFKRRWPLPNLWLGTSIENQKTANDRIPLLQATPAALRFLSCEPLLDHVDLFKAAGIIGHELPTKFTWFHDRSIHWVICGGESGPHARPMSSDWARFLRDQCHIAEVPFFFKQFGEWIPADQIESSRLSAIAEKHIQRDVMPYYRIGKKAAGHLLDGVEHLNFPIWINPAGTYKSPQEASSK